MFETASQYLLFGGLWLLSLTRTPKLPKYALALLITGIALFCGSLLIYLILPIKALMLLTPIGGLTLIAAFVYLGLNANENA